MFGQSGNFSGWQCGPGIFLPGPFGMIISLLFWGMVLFLVIKMLRYFFWPKENKQPANYNMSPIEILTVRYAEGEVSKAEFEQMKKDIS